MDSNLPTRLLSELGAVAAGLWLAVAAPGVQAAEVRCTRADVLVALAPGEPARYGVAGELCATAQELRDGTSVQLLMHGATYSHEYWDFGEVHETRYSYARAVADYGMATFAYDAIGAGGSSHPPSERVTLEAAAYVTHQLVRALRSGTLSGTRFGKVIAVGHALGSLIVWQEATRYADVDGVVVTGAVHSLSNRFNDAVTTAFQPAVNDPRFATTGLDRGYLTTVPGARAGLFSAAFLPEEEQHKDVVPAAELESALPLISSQITRAIRVPVLTILGSNDVTTCGPNTRGGAFDCSSAAALASQESPFYSPQARLRACLIPGAGNDLNLTLNHELQVADILAWSTTFVDTRLRHEANAASGDARTTSAADNDGLPPNCSAVARQVRASLIRSRG
jgi:pimeloyl-ACP methyl ester carboxylesterase